MARILIIGGGCRGRRLAGLALRDGHAVRITTRSEGGRATIEATGSECWVGTPDRLATLRGALDGVTIACWLLGSARGTCEQVRALHGSRLRFFIEQTIDTTVRGFVYEAAGAAQPRLALQEGEQIARALTEHNAIPCAVLTTPPGDDAWLTGAWGAVQDLLAGRDQPPSARPSSVG